REAPPPVFAVSDPTEIKRCERLWWFDIVHNVFYRVGMFNRFDDYFEEVFHAFGGPAHWALYPETSGVLKELKDRGLELGIISNFDTRLFIVHDVEPPQPLTPFDLGRVADGKDRRRSLTERTPERGIESRKRLVGAPDPIFLGVVQIDLSHRPLHMKQGPGCVKEYDFHPAHDAEDGSGQTYSDGVTSSDTQLPLSN